MTASYVTDFELAAALRWQMEMRLIQLSLTRLQLFCQTNIRPVQPHSHKSPLPA